MLGGHSWHSMLLLMLLSIPLESGFLSIVAFTAIVDAYEGSTVRLHFTRPLHGIVHFTRPLHRIMCSTTTCVQLIE